MMIHVKYIYTGKATGYSILSADCPKLTLK